MGFFSTFGEKTTANGLGQKVSGVAKRVGKVADTVADVSKGVAAITGTLAAGAAMVGAEPLAAGLLATAAAAKGLEGLSTGVSMGASAISGGIDVAGHGVRAIDNIRAGDYGGAFKEGTSAISGAKEATKKGRASKKQIEKTRR